MEKKAVPRGAYGYVTSDDGMLAVRWKDNKTLCQYCHSAVNRHGGGVDVLSHQVLSDQNEGACELSTCHQKLCHYGGIDKRHACTPLPHLHEIQEVIPASVCICHLCQ